MTSATEEAVTNTEAGPSHRSDFFSLELSTSAYKNGSVDRYKVNSVREGGKSDKSDVLNIGENVNNVEAENVYKYPY